MRKDVREFIRRLEAQGLTVEPTPGHYHPDTTRWRRTAILDLRKLGIDV
jgi:hypothetical protein